ncbi:interleukin-1 receptor-like 1 [Pyxicephalus adspersus]|uniref:interleukin-1 receptor-like 1 n=1 Tax=Pyxicephalus adspersus TaxID=30357 RepID=UPI003B5C708E
MEREMKVNISLKVFASIQESCTGEPRMKELKLTQNYDCTRLQGKHDTTLYISNISRSDTGNYTCAFTYMYNGKSYNVTRNIPVKVLVLFFYTDRENYDLISTNAQVPKRHHKSKSRSYNISLYVIYMESNLTILKVEEDDYKSNYSCFAYNNRGKDEMIRILKSPVTDRVDHIVVSVIILGAVSCLLPLLYTRLKIDFVLLSRDIFKKYYDSYDGKEYDAYVVYSRDCHENSIENSAEYFVNTVLPEVLEHKCGFRLFIPGRNMVPGEDVSSSSAVNIEKSRRLIIVLSAQTRSMESFYDQQIGLHSALISNSLKVIIITLGEINENTEMQESLGYIMKRKGTIQWNDKSNDKFSPNSKFWKLVRYQMPACFSSYNFHHNK